jgi:hypothetical protein
MKSHTRPNLIKFLEICQNTRVFRQLRTLRKVRRCMEIIHIEDARAALGVGVLSFSRMDLHKSEVTDIRVGTFAAESLGAEYCLVYGCLEDGRWIGASRSWSRQRRCRRLVTM